MQRSPTRHDIRKVVIVLAGSRTGSSYLFKKMKSVGEFIAPCGEETPFYRLAGICKFTGKSFSDEILSAPPENVLDRAASLLLADSGIRTQSRVQDVDRDLFVDDCFARLEIQWPGVISRELRAELQPRLIDRVKQLPSGFDRWREFYFEWLTYLSGNGISVEPELMNTLSNLSDRVLERLPLIEEPPYVAPEPRLRLSVEDCARSPLLLKTSTNVYRTPLLRALFPNAQFKWILLQRNPAATVGALMDGWLSSSFQSYDLKGHTKLAIPGYSDKVSGGERYWKYDMPPGWIDYVQKPLAEVCAFQWFSAHKIIEAFSRQTQDPCLRIKYEDLIQERLFPKLMQDIFKFSGVPFGDIGSIATDEPVAAVGPPAPGRWNLRADAIEPALKKFWDGKLFELAEKLEYDVSHYKTWP